MPVAAVQRKACWLPGTALKPTMTDPSAETPLAELLIIPGRVPRLTMPVASVQRNAWKNGGAELLRPTTTDPSAEAPCAELFVCPGRCPRPTMPVVWVQRNA